MELAYLGLFSKVFNWVLDRIFEPIFKWLTGLLNTVFTWIFEKIFAPILLPILEEALEFFIDLYMDIYSSFIYTLFAGVLRLVDYMETAFDVFIGIQDVKFYPDPSNTSNVIEGPLVEVLLQQKTVSMVFWLLTAAGLAIALMLTIFAVSKSSFDLDFENKRPVSKVLTAMMKTFIQFFMVPFFVYFMLMLSAEILKIASEAITGSTPTSLGRIVFTVASMNAAKEAKYNASSNPSFSLGTDPRDKARYPFYIKNADKVNNIQPKDYADLSMVRGSNGNGPFDISEFDYLIGFLAAIFLLFVMAICLITFVQRLFDIVLLYIVSPYFVSTMPLDDGERFGRWRDMFLGKCFTGFGSAIGMRLYLLVCQMIMGNSIRFSDSQIGSSIEMDYIMKLFFLIGGAWAVFKSGPMITQLISAGAGQQEMQTQAVAGGALYGHTIGKAMHVGKGAIMSGLRKGASSLASRGHKGRNADPQQKFEGSKGDRMAKASSTWKNGVVSTNAQRSKIAIGAHRTRSDVKQEVRPRRMAMSNDPKHLAAARAASAKVAASKMAAAANAAPKIKPGRLAMSNDPKHLAAARAARNAAGLGTGNTSTNTTDTLYKEKKNFRLGSMLQSTYDANGNHKIRVLGVGVDRDASGNTMAVKMPVAGLKVQRTDPEQSMKLARMHIPGIARINSNVQNGQIKYSDISVLHGAVRYNHDESGSKYRVLGGVANVSNGKDGASVSVLGGLGQYRSDTEGNHVSVAGIHGHSFHDGSSGVDVGKLHVRTGNDGDTVNLGNHVSFKTSGDHMQSVKIGSLEYSRSGVKKSVPQSAKTSMTSTNKPGSGNKQGGK